MVRFYLVPVEIGTGGNTRGPKYFPWRYDADPPALIQEPSQQRDYGNEPLMLLASDLTDAEDATLSAQIDVTKFADNLDLALGADLARMQSALEALKLPAQMLTAATTYRQVIRGIMGIFLIAQCMQGKGFNVFAAGVTLSTTLNSLSAAVRTALTDCATSLGFDTTGITGASTVRQVLTAIANQASPSPMLGVTV
jgi:hypothetical protein